MITKVHTLLTSCARRVPAFWRRPVGLALVVSAVAVVLGGAGALAYLRHLRGAAEAAFARRDLAEARGHAEAYLRLWPYDAEAHLLACRIARLEGRLRDAEQHLSECNRLLGGATPRTQLEGMLLRARPETFAEVEALLWHAVDEQNADSPLIFEALAQCYMILTDIHGAKKALNGWVGVEPENARAWSWRAWANEMWNQRDSAAADYQQSLRLKPDRLTRQRYIRLLVTKGHQEELAAQAALLAQDDPELPEVLLARACVLQLQKRIGEARKSYDELYRKHPDYAFGRTQRAELEFEDLQWAAAERWARDAIQFDPLSPEGHYLLWKSLEAQPGRAEEAQRQKARWQAMQSNVKRLRELLADNPNAVHRDSRQMLEIAEIYLDGGLPKMAETWLLRVLDREPGSPQAHALLARCYEATGQAEKAARHRELAAKGS